MHKVHATFAATQRLEHIGFALDSIQAVEQLFHNLQKHGFNIAQPPKTFGIGTYSFSVTDPDGIEVEVMKPWRGRRVSLAGSISHLIGPFICI